MAINKILPSNRTITNESPNAPLRTTGGLGDSIIALGQTGAQISEKIKQASILAEKTRAENAFDGAIMDIQTRAAADNDISENNVGKYEDEIEKAISDSAKHLTIPAYRELFQNDAIGRADAVRNKVRNGFVSKAIDLGKQELEIFAGNKKDQFISAASVQEQEKARLEMDTKIAEALDAGYLDPAGAAKMRAEYPKEWAKAQVEHDIATDPDLAKKLLEEKAYSDLYEEDRVKYINDARTASNKIMSDLKDQLKKQQIQTEAQYISDFMKGDLDLASVPSIGQAIANRQIRPEFGNAVIKALQKPLEDIDLDEEGEAFMSMVDSLLNASNTEDINNAVMDVLNGFSSGNLGQEKMQILIQSSMKFGEQSEAKNQLRNVVTASIKAGFVNDPDAAADYLAQINKGEDPMKAAAIAMRNKQIKEVPERSTYEVGQVIKRGNRSAKVVGYREDGMPLLEVVNAQ